ncbi:MAG TPA: aminotransferase class I/II-fold pyridoxal phosphate-dependent enzyme, partial [Clostridia bacterium]|nr:aminotransferase class I/II-fold pyridoxal phosphate-dependent enzyme [Clostridia bacterium]
MNKEKDMTAYASRSDQALQREIKALESQLDALRKQKLALNMTRGKPAPQQLDLVSGLASCLGPNDYRSEDGTDCRNYGGAQGLWEMRRLFADLLDLDPESVWALGSSSLTLMYDLLVRCLLFRLPDGQKPWHQEKNPAFLCPVPGYDRHFFATESLGFDLISVPMTSDGPDMDVVEDLVANDPRIKGMWCVPQYSNPQGVVYSQETCQRLSAMKTAASDFRLFWDHAYVVHHLDPDRPESIPDILS